MLAIGQINPATVTKIYRGKDSVCRCGCKGTYAYPGTKAFGRHLSEVNKMIQRKETDGVDLQPTYMNVTLPNDRALTVYFD